MLTLHPTASGLRNFKGATVRIDPLATMQVMCDCRYMNHSTLDNNYESL